MLLCSHFKNMFSPDMKHVISKANISDISANSVGGWILHHTNKGDVSVGGKKLRNSLLLYNSASTEGYTLRSDVRLDNTKASRQYFFLYMSIVYTEHA